MNKLNNEKLEELKKKLANSTITHWVRDMGVKCNIFTIQISTYPELRYLWKDIADEIAAYFMDIFENEYEAWNLYIVFFAGVEIPRDLKYNIENDKYSTRKIVLDDMPLPIDDKEIVEKISKRIFLLDIESDSPPKERQKDLSQIIDERLYSHISNVNLQGQTKTVLEKREQVFKNIYREYSNEI